MSYAKQLLDSYPGTLNADAGTLACRRCEQACRELLGVLR